MISFEASCYLGACGKNPNLYSPSKAKQTGKNNCNWTIYNFVLKLFSCFSISSSKNDTGNLNGRVSPSNKSLATKVSAKPTKDELNALSTQTIHATSTENSSRAEALVLLKSYMDVFGLTFNFNDFGNIRELEQDAKSESKFKEKIKRAENFSKEKDDLLEINRKLDDLFEGKIPDDKMSQTIESAFSEIINKFSRAETNEFKTALNSSKSKFQSKKIIQQNDEEQIKHINVNEELKNCEKASKIIVTDPIMKARYVIRLKDVLNRKVDTKKLKIIRDIAVKKLIASVENALNKTTNIEDVKVVTHFVLCKLNPDSDDKDKNALIVNLWAADFINEHYKVRQQNGRYEILEVTENNKDKLENPKDIKIAIFQIPQERFAKSKPIESTTNMDSYKLTLTEEQRKDTNESTLTSFARKQTSSWSGFSEEEFVETLKALAKEKQASISFVSNGAQES